MNATAEKITAPADGHKIELRPDERREDAVKAAADGRKPAKKNPGGFDIFVDGKLWGRTRMDRRGVHGADHYIEQVRSNGSSSNAFVLEDRGAGTKFHRKAAKYFSTVSDKSYLRRLRHGEKKLTLAERIEQKAREAIAAGALKDPDAMAEEVAAVAEHRRREQEEADRARDAEFEARAEQALDEMADLIGGDLKWLSAEANAACRSKIVAAMKWAQTK